MDGGFTPCRHKAIIIQDEDIQPLYLFSPVMMTIIEKELYAADGPYYYIKHIPTGQSAEGNDEPV